MATKLDNFFAFLIFLCIVILLVVTLAAVCRADWTPVGYNDWQQGNERVSDFGRLPENYQKQDGSWEEIDTTWQSVGDTLFTCRKAVVIAEAWPNGVSAFTVTLNNKTVTIEQTLDRLILVDTLTWERYDLITDLPLSNFVHEGRELRWNFPGGLYRLRKGFGRTAAQVVFKKALLDSVCKIYGKLPLDSITTMVDSLYWDEEGDSMVVVQVQVVTTLPERVALGTVFKYEIIGVSDSLLAKLTSRPGVNKKKLFRWGRRQLSITSNKLHFQGEENVREIPVLQQWRKVGGDFYLCEYLMMWQLDSLHTVFPNKSVWHGATEQVQDFSIEDTHITEPSNPGYNYGNATGVRIGRAFASNTDTIALIRPSGDIADALGLGATTNSCSLFIYLTNVGDVGDIDCYQSLKYFFEGDNFEAIPFPDSGATWAFFQGLRFRATGIRGFHWTALDAGIHIVGPWCADDSGIENVIDNGTCVAARADRAASSMDQVNVTATQYYGWEITTSLAQHWYDNGDPYGVMLWPANVVSVTFSSSEVTGDINGPANVPYFRYRYTVAEAAGQVILID